MPEFTKAQRDQAARVIAFEIRDPLTGVRSCRWCLFRTPDAQQDGGEYLCPQCGRWQAEKAFPQGVPGLTQVTDADQEAR